MPLEVAQAIALPDEVANIARLAKSLFSKETVPTTLAAIAVVVSVWAAFISRKSMKASERSAAAAEIQAGHAASQAEAAEIQARAAMDQANSASSEAGTAHHQTEISALEAARQRIDARMPRVMTVIFKKEDLAGLSENLGDLPIPLPAPTQGKRVRLDHWSTDGSVNDTPHWAWDAYFVSHGLLHNYGNEPVRVVRNGVQFYAGVHPATGEELREPMTDHHGVRILHPGQTTLFQVVASKQVDDWVNVLKSGEKEQEVCEAYLWFYPADSEEPECGVKLVTSGLPLERHSSDEVYAIFKPGSYFDLNITHIRKYPDSTQEILLRLKGDQEDVAWFMIKKEQDRAIRDYVRNRARDEVVDEDSPSPMSGD
ncbi:hypothetical protein [Pseudosporangium ferrugineum]|uniref:Uncharacterized protein n=1 Tax=Pseudosporangium ferrugineum TaxID=439699 RepID=A0A2T0RD79_9ACTN|nr:hypothetical protein [Pseudosporangium ferrugineum]PRY19125.1 hypothetical protein CLV70_1382 [Pseudosporangium ferrugineum]